jgi:hypothetical protein
MNRNLLTSALLGLALLTFGSIASADDYSDTIKLFKDAGESNGFFARS